MIVLYESSLKVFFIKKNICAKFELVMQPYILFQTNILA